MNLLFIHTTTVMVLALLPIAIGTLRVTGRTDIPQLHYLIHFTALNITNTGISTILAFIFIIGLGKQRGAGDDLSDFKF